MTKNIEQKNSPDIKKNIGKRMLQVLIQLLLSAVILFVAAGRIDWVWAWVYLASFILMIAVNVMIMPPELIAERGKSKENVKKWDKVITTLSAFPAFSMMLVAGLDNRFGWSPKLNISVHIIGLVLMILGNALFSWAMVSNKFFSTLVRIQFDRGHAVATSGPYSYVRHPGYVGFIVSSLAAPLIFGSLWSLVPGGLAAGLFVLRTAFEDRTLQEELDGYKDYAEKVPYRLLPGIW